MLNRGLLILCLSLSTVLADVQFTTPGSGATAELTGGQLAIAWKEGTGTPALSELAGFTLFLMAGGNSEATAGQVATVAGPGALSAGILAAQMPVTAASGPGDPNAYFLKSVAQLADGSGSVINYSNRFTISGMTGSFPASSSGESAAQVQAAYEQVKGDLTAVPPTVNQAGPAAPAAGGAATGSFAVSYQFQSGPIKYAPMQQKPGTTITATNTAPLYPTSSVQIAVTHLPIPTVISTQTEPINYSTSSAVNTAAAQSQPPNAMQKFLNRWKD